MRSWELAFTALAALVLSVAGMPAMPFGVTHAAALDLSVTKCDTFGGSGQAGTLGDALAQAEKNNGSTITFACEGTAPFTIYPSTISVSNTLTISSPARNVTLDGGGMVRLFYVKNTGNLTLDGLTLSHGLGGGVVDWGGGAVLNYHGSLTISNSILIGNAAKASPFDPGSGPEGYAGYGGAVGNVSGSLTIANSLFAGNIAFGGDGRELIKSLGWKALGGSGGDGLGGAVWSLAHGPGSHATITNSTFADNIVFGGRSGGGGGKDGHGYGGAIYNTGSALTITNSTFTGNVAGVHNSTDIPVVTSLNVGIPGFAMIGLDLPSLSKFTSNGYGGALYNEGAQASITNSTFTGNRTISGSGGGVGNGGNPSTLSIANSILVGNSAGAQGTDNCTGTIRDEGYNVTNSFMECGFFARTDLLTKAPLFSELAANGGSTPTFSLLPGSLAIDQIPQGINGCGTTVMTDQRGIARPQGAKCDIGAFEVDKTAPTTTASVSPEADSNGWYTAEVTVSLKSEDNVGGSGVKAIYYMLNHGAEHVYTAPFPIISNGEYILTYWSIDNLGNTETAKTLTIKLDKTASAGASPFGGASPSGGASSPIVSIGIGLAGVVIAGLIVVLLVRRRRKGGAGRTTGGPDGAGGAGGAGPVAGADGREPSEERPLAEVH